jgi:hypothetical protein
MAGLLYTLVVLFLILWVVGFLVAHVASPLIHLLLVIAVVVLLYQMFTGRRAAL